MAAAPGSVRLRYEQRRGLFLPWLPSGVRAQMHKDMVRACPGAGVDLVALARRLLDHEGNYDVDLGLWNGMWVSRSLDGSILRDASSGGLMTSIARFLLVEGLVEGVVVTEMVYGAPGPRTRTFIARREEDLFRAQGSKYCPVPAVAILGEAGNLPRSLAFVGTPCQISAVRMLQEIRPEVGERVRFCIGNFCGGIRDFRETDTLIRRYGLDPAGVVRFRYRGGGQPGSLEARDKEGKVVSKAYPDYVRDTGYAKLLRCRLCVDATAELADFSCGDAWLERFLTSGLAWSIVMTRTKEAARVFERMRLAGLVAAEAIAPEEVKASQRINLTSKKRRQHARRKLYRLLGQPLPMWDGGFQKRGGGVLFEALVAMSHRVAEGAESGGFAYRIIDRIGRRAKEHVKKLIRETARPRSWNG